MTPIRKTALTDIASIAHVRRWHAMNVHREQTVAEHTVLVTFYAYELLQRIYPDHSAEEAMALLLDSLWHDVPEGIQGDVPTPVKRYLESQFEEDNSPLDQLERAICPEHHRYRTAVKDTPLLAISKLADILEAQHFIMVEGKPPRKDSVFRGRGRAFVDLVEASRKRWPELNWSEAFSMRDELFYGDGAEIEFKESFQK